MKRIILFLFLSIFILGCTTQTEDINTQENATVQMEEGTKVVMTTSKGDITMILYEDMPVTTTNFLNLIGEGFYKGLTFHRYEPGFVIQGGDPNGDGTGGSTNTIELEISEARSHSRGTLGMARSNDPNSASSQFFINLGDNTFLDGNYAVFGYVSEGMDVVDQLRVGDVILSMQVIS